MKDKGTQKRIRLQQEQLRDRAQEASIENSVRRWKRRTGFLGAAFLASVGSVAPFLDGQPLHSHFSPVGRVLIYIAMLLLSVFMYAAATTYNLRSHLRELKRIHGSSAASPGSDLRL